MDEQTMLYAKEISNLIGESWKAIVISAGISAGIFDELSPDNPVSIEDMIRKNKYSFQKLDMWFYFMERLGIVSKVNDKYILTPKGVLFSGNSPFKDLLGLFQITDYFMQSAVNSRENFKPDNSQDSLTKGALSNEYQTKVTDNLSSAILEIFKKYDVGANDSLLDFGCGNGNLLRALLKALPLMKLKGVDLNAHAIEKGKSENIKNGIKINKIHLMNGDVINDIDKFPDNSHDWVTGINLFHFIKMDSRMPVIDNMIRLCRKGIFFTETIIESSMMSAGANPLLSLLWNDFTGFFKKDEADKLNDDLKNKYGDYTFDMMPIIQGTSNIVILKKKSA
jgi:SAM-dependent methyltransferase